eukprot:TRINITY_DN7611_c0_g1_i1.p1 TRINITY_DN7611_c0_g1~~TRINITY_DN7611_c0_g1_i1.p1  ORF type:complete len:480 (+),score=62.80 TRINITY_DN7611_c0_g1_i1:27-1466(+)
MKKAKRHVVKAQEGDVQHDFKLLVHRVMGLTPGLAYGVKWKRGDHKKGKTPVTQSNRDGNVELGFVVNVSGTMQVKHPGNPPVFHRKEITFKVKQYDGSGGKGKKTGIKFRLNLSDVETDRPPLSLMLAAKDTPAKLLVSVSATSQALPGRHGHGKGAVVAIGYDTDVSAGSGSEAEDNQMRQFARQPTGYAALGANQPRAPPQPQWQQPPQQFAGPPAVAQGNQWQPAQQYGQPPPVQQNYQQPPAAFQQAPLPPPPQPSGPTAKEAELEARLKQLEAQLRKVDNGGDSASGASGGGERSSLLRPQVGVAKATGGIFMAYILLLALGFVHSGHWLWLAWRGREAKNRPSAIRWVTHAAFYWAGNIAFWVLRFQLTSLHEPCPNGEWLSQDCLFHSQPSSFTFKYVVQMSIVAWVIVTWAMDFLCLWMWMYQSDKGKPLTMPCAANHTHYWSFLVTAVVTTLIVVVCASVSWTLSSRII